MWVPLLGESPREPFPEAEPAPLHAGALGVWGDTPSLPRPSGRLGGCHCLCSPSRESKELADLARLHPTSCAANGLNPNLMVTGGPSLAGSGRWSADPAAHLATHPWLPRSGSTSMWLAGHPYGKCGAGDFSCWLRTEWARHGCHWSRRLGQDRGCRGVACETHAWSWLLCSSGRPGPCPLCRCIGSFLCLKETVAVTSALWGFLC